MTPYAPKTFVLDTDSESRQVLADIVDEVNYFLKRLSPGSLATVIPTPGADVVHLTEDKRHTGASGYHILMNGVPTAYCAPEAVAYIYGYYNSGILPAKVDAHGKVLHPATKIHEPLMTPGLITVICHEIAEMLADGNVVTYCPADSKGNQWLMEPCDFVFGEYFEAQVGSHACIFPNVALPSFWTLGAPAPYDLMNLVKAPFQRSPRGYAYYLDRKTGKQVPVTY